MKHLLYALLVVSTSAFALPVSFTPQSGQIVWGTLPGHIPVKFQSNMKLGASGNGIGCWMCFGEITITVPGHTFETLTLDAYAHPPGGTWTDIGYFVTTGKGVRQEGFWGTNGGPDYRTITAAGIESIKILDVYQPFSALEDINISGLSGERSDPTPEPSTLWLMGLALSVVAVKLR